MRRGTYADVVNQRKIWARLQFARGAQGEALCRKFSMSVWMRGRARLPPSRFVSTLAGSAGALALPIFEKLRRVLNFQRLTSIEAAGLLSVNIPFDVLQGKRITVFNG